MPTQPNILQHKVGGKYFSRPYYCDRYSRFQQVFDF